MKSIELSSAADGLRPITPNKNKLNQPHQSKIVGIAFLLLFVVGLVLRPLSLTPQQPNSILSLASPATAKKEGVAFLFPWLAAQLLAAWCGLHSQIQINSLSLFIPEKINSIVFSSMKERAAQVDLICSFHFNCCFLFISLVDRLRLSSLWASCLGAGPPAIT